MSAERIEKILAADVWKSHAERFSSYELKHIIERKTGIYMTDAEMQRILTEHGFARVKNTESWFTGKINPVLLNDYYRGGKR